MNDSQWKEFSKHSGEDLDSYMYHNILDIVGGVLDCTDREVDLIIEKLKAKNITVVWKL